MYKVNDERLSGGERNISAAERRIPTEKVVSGYPVARAYRKNRVAAFDGMSDRRRKNEQALTDHQRIRRGDAVPFGEESRRDAGLFCN